MGHQGVSSSPWKYQVLSGMQAPATGETGRAAFGPLLTAYWKLLTTSNLSRDHQAPVTPPPPTPLSPVPPCAGTVTRASSSAPSGAGKMGHRLGSVLPAGEGEPACRREGACLA